MISKKDKIKAIQSALGTKPDGIIGNHTADVLYRQFTEPVMPYEGSFFGCKVIIGDPKFTHVYDADGKHTVRDFTYSISGSFTWPSGAVPVSILVDNGQVFRNESCHYFMGMPETVLWYKYNGDYGLSLVKTANELPEGVKWAIGGGRMVPTFNNVAEGFVGKYSDVFRRTAHCGIGFDKYGNVLAIYHHRDTLNGFRQRCLNIGMEQGIFLDGGHISAINAGTLKANLNQRQGYIIQL